MKRVAVLLFALASAAWAQDTIYYESTPTLQWDAVTQDTDGNPFLPGDTVEYEVYLWDMAGGDPTMQPVTAFTLYETTSSTDSLLSFPYRSEWACIVRTKHADGGVNVTYSVPAYSVVAGDTASGPFVYSPTLLWLPRAPTGLQDSGI